MPFLCLNGDLLCLDDDLTAQLSSCWSNHVTVVCLDRMVKNTLDYRPTVVADFQCVHKATIITVQVLRHRALLAAIHDRQNNDAAKRSIHY